MDGSDWGPAPNNVDRGSQLDEEEEADEEAEDEEEKEEKEEEERKAANIKSNNPHLAGGEKKLCFRSQVTQNHRNRTMLN